MEHFGLFLVELGKEERQVDIMRQVLADQPKFQPFEAFRYLNENNWTIGTQDLPLHKPSKIELIKSKAMKTCILKSLDTSNSGTIRYSDFLAFIKPNTPSESPLPKTEISKTKPCIPLEIKYALSRLFQREIELHRNLEMMKEELIKKYKISLQECFFSIFKGGDQDGFGMEELTDFVVDKCGFELIDEEVKAIFKRLDKDQDGVVSCEDFANVVLPLHYDKQEQINWMHNQCERLREEELTISFEEEKEVPLKRKVKKKKKTNHKNYTSKATTRSKLSSTTKSVISLKTHKPKNKSHNSIKSTKTFYKPKKHDLKPQEKKRKKYAHKVEESMSKVRHLIELKRLEELEAKRSLTRSYSQAINLKTTQNFVPDYMKENLVYPGLESSIEKAYSETELKMENLKQELCHREDFNIFEVYKSYFDPSSKGYISQEDFDTAMDALGVKRRYILPENLQYSSFCSLLLPISKEHADLAINRMPINCESFGENTDSTGNIKLLGHTHKTLQDMLREVFDQIILCVKDKDMMQSKCLFGNTSALSELDTNL